MGKEKWTNSDLQKNKQKTKDRVTKTILFKYSLIHIVRCCIYLTTYD
jgi:hypothetical protein